jgi:hypothetical protein
MFPVCTFSGTGSSTHCYAQFEDKMALKNGPIMIGFYIFFKFTIRVAEKVRTLTMPKELQQLAERNGKTELMAE